MPRPALPALAALVLAAAPAPAQPGVPKRFEEVGAVDVRVVPDRARRGETVTVRLTVTPKPGGWTYPANPKDPAQPSKNVFGVPREAGTLIFAAPAADPPGFAWREKPREGADGAADQYSDGPVTWEFPAVVSPLAPPGPAAVGLDAPPRTRVQVCTADTCLYPRSLPAAALEVLPGDPVAVEERFRPAVVKALAPKVRDAAAALFAAAIEKAYGPSGGAPAPAPSDPPKKLDAPPPGKDDRGGPKPAAPPAAHYAPKEPKPADQYRGELEAVAKGADTSGVTDAAKDESLGGFVLTAVIWGLVSLVTPCVFPMIPITVSIFLKHAHGSFRERMKLAAVYCLTIVVVLGLSAFALLRFMAVLSAHPVTNVLLGALFVALALSLFGMYELTLPNFMVRRLQAKQSKGGAVGTVFGALAFTVISFTCVAPFLGGFAGISAADSGNTSLVVWPTTKEILGGLAFATAFAAPFFVLALVPGLLRALPKSGGWLDSVKVVMGFLELAAALKFFRTAELRVFSPAEFFTYDLVLAGWVGIALACGLYLLNAYRLPHDEERPNVGVPRLLFALLFLGLGVYLLPGVFKGADGKSQRPGGAVFAWVDAFLLPEPRHLGWSTDLPAVADAARAEGAKAGRARPVFVDFTGVTCSNCRYNENAVFPQPKVNDLLDQFERVQLYTDEVPADLYATDPGRAAREDEARANDDFKYEVFRDQRLPLYAVFLPTADGRLRLLGKYDEGKINSPDKFAAWLKDMLAKARK